MKKQKIIIIFLIIIIVLISAISTILVYKKCNPICGYYKIIKSEYKLTGKAENIKPYTGNVPDFTLAIGGVYDTTITGKDVINYKIPVYEFDASIMTSWETKRDHYTGIKLKDALEKMNIKDYTTLKFFGYPFKTVMLEAKDIDFDNTYLILYRNNNKILDFDLSLIAINKDYNFSFEGLAEIIVDSN